MTLELKKFSMNHITFAPNENKGPVVVLIGRRDTGKSYLVRDLLYYHQDIPIGTVVSGTEAGNGFYGSHVPKLFIHDEYNTAIIENILKRQKAALKSVKKEIQQYKIIFRVFAALALYLTINNSNNELIIFSTNFPFFFETNKNISHNNHTQSLLYLFSTFIKDLTSQ